MYGYINFGKNSVGGENMAKKGNSRGKAASAVNPQGQGQDVEFSQEPASQLENRAKKKNTKI